MEKNFIIGLSDFLNESNKFEPFEKFSDNRLKGAAKISENAHKKGGDALLTYHHFMVKLPYYEKAKNGKFNPAKESENYKKLLEKLYTSTKDGMNISQVEFQKIMGKIEVIGELLIKDKKP
jgi:hypothetical protein